MGETKKYDARIKIYELPRFTGKQEIDVSLEGVTSKYLTKMLGTVTQGLEKLPRRDEKGKFIKDSDHRRREK